MNAKKILAIFLSVLMIFGTMPLVFAADTVDADGNLVISDGVEEITTQQYYRIGGGKTLKTVKLSDTIKSIGLLGFAYNEELTTVDFGNGIETIGEFAFAQCYSLEAIVIPDSVREIQQQAFFGCKNVKVVDLGEGVITIGEYAFQDVKTDVLIIPDSLENVAKSAFTNAEIGEVVFNGDEEKLSQIFNGVLPGVDENTIIHYWEDREATTATCFEPALAAGKWCSTCEKYERGGEVTAPALGCDWDAGTLTRPALVDGAWVDGYYTYVCQRDADHPVNTVAAPRADYTEYDALKAEVEAMAEISNLTEAGKAQVQAALDSLLAVALDYIATEQDELDGALVQVVPEVEELDELIDAGDIVKADYTELNNAIAALEALAETENLTDAAKAAIEAAITAAEAVADDLTQSTADKATMAAAVKAAQDAIDAAEAAIADGSALKADYTALDAAIAALEALAATAGLTDAAAAAIANAITAAEAVDAGLTQSAADKATMAEAVAAAQAAINAANAAIADGSALKADYSELEAAIAALEAALETEGLTDAAIARLEAALEAAKAVDAGLTQSADDKATMAAAVKAATDAAVVTGADLKADYTALNEAIAALEALKATTGLTDEAIAAIDAAIAAAEAVADDLTQSDADKATIAAAVKAAADAIAAAEAAIADGSALKADYTDLDAAIEALKEALKTEGLTEAAKERLENALAAAEAVSRDLTQSDADKATMADAIQAATDAAVVTDSDKVADASGAEAAKKELEDLLKTDDLTDEVKAEIEAEIEKLEELIEKIENEELTKADQAEIDSAVADSNAVADKIAADIESGAAIKADYSEYEAAYAAAEALLATPKLTEASKAMINDALAANVVEAGLTADKQGIIDAATANLEELKADVDADIASGAALEANYAEYNTVRAALVALKNTADLKAEYAAKIQAALDANVVEAGLTADKQGTIDAATAAMQAVIDEVGAAIADGTALDADTSALEELIGKLEDLLETEGLTEEAAKEIQDAIDAAQGVVDSDPSKSEKDLEKLENAIDAAQGVIDGVEADIASGAALKADFTAYEAAKAALAALKLTLCLSADSLAAIDAEIAAVAAVESYNKDKQADIDAATKALTDAKAEMDAAIADDSALDHTEADVVVENFVDSTCYAEGSYDDVVYCAVCGVELSRTAQSIEKKAHTEGAAVIENNVDPTCTADGSYDTVVYCAVEECKEELSRVTTVVGALGHSAAEAVEENRVDATCMAKGSYDMVVYCSACDIELDRASYELDIVDCSFTKYEFNNDADWGVDGTETAYCDYGCGASVTRTAVGSMLIADYSEVDELVGKIEELLGGDSLSEEMTQELEDLKQKIEDLKADPTTSQDEVDELVPALERIKEYAAEINAERGGFGLFYWLWRFIKAVVEFILTLEWTF